jgi:hypothetical protein
MRRRRSLRRTPSASGRSRSAIALLAALALGGCATTGGAGGNAAVSIDPAADFDRFRTFDVMPSPPGGATSGLSPAVAETLRGVPSALERSLASVNLTRSPGGSADLLVTAFPGGTPVSTQALGYTAAFDPVLSVASVGTASLVVDLVDARTHRLVWRGVAEGALASPTALDPALLRMLRAYYPTRAAFYRKPQG